MMGTTPSPSRPHAGTRRYWATGIDVSVAPLSFVALAYGSMGVDRLMPVGVSGEARYILTGALPGVVWLALVGLCAWRGQTVGQLAVGLRWMRRADSPARWRPLREPSFWCTALAGLLFVGCAMGILAATLVELAVWRVGHVMPGAPGPGLGVVVTMALVVGITILVRSARRDPAYLARP